MVDRAVDTSDERTPGLLTRWSQRKAQARAGAVAPEAASAPAVVAPPPAFPAAASPTTAEPAPPPPTLEDVAALAPGADVARFVLPGVDEGVKRAALKKLFFSDPRFNVMDGLDTYIDDYGLPDPIPESMLRRMVQSRALGLFDHEEPEAPAGEPQATPDGMAAPALPQSPTAAAPAASEPADEDPSVRLQQDDAADAAGARADRPHPRA